MSRNRVIYQSEALFVGPTPATGFHFLVSGSGAISDILSEVTGQFSNIGIKYADISNRVAQLHRVQSCNYNFSVARKDVNQFGQLAAIDRVIVDAPVVNMDFSYLVTDAENEQTLGFVTNGSCSAISGLLNKTEDEKNYFVLVTPEGTDAAGNLSGPTAKNVIGIGNGFISSYSTEAAVGGIPTVTVNVEGINFKVDGSSSGQWIPAVNPIDGTAISNKRYTMPIATSGNANQTTALRPGDITWSLGSAGIGVALQSQNIQSYRLSFNLTRQPLQRLGNKFAFSKEIQFPVTCTMSVDAQVSDLTSGSLSDILCNDANYDLTVTLHQPSCTGSGPVALAYTLKGAKLDSQNFSSSIGPNKTVTAQFSAQLSGPEDTSKGFFISGITF